MNPFFRFRFSSSIMVICASNSAIGLSSAQVCAVAYSSMSSQSRVECNTTGLTPDQLKTEQCPVACQSLYDEVLASCNPGDSYLESLPSFEYEEVTLFASQGHKWASCNYGHTPSDCERAFSYMDELGNDYTAGVCNIEDLSLDQLKSEQCPSACQALYDEVLANCNDGDIYNVDLPSTSLFDYAEDTLLLEEGHKWVSCNYGYTPSACQRAYINLEGQNLQCSSWDKSDEQLETEECPAVCQELYDNVVANCRPGIDSYLTPTSNLGIQSLSIYEEALLWHDDGRRKQCDYGYDPTLCDLAIRDLYESTFLDMLYGADANLCASADNAAACTPACMVNIDAVVSACPIGAEFAPNAGHLRQTYRRIPFEGPKSLDLLGMNFFLSENCWNYYTATSPPQSAFTTSAPTPAPTPALTLVSDVGY